MRVYHYSWDDAKGRYFTACRETNTPCNRCKGAESTLCPSAFITVSLAGADARLLMETFRQADLRETIRQGVYRGAPLPNSKRKGAEGWEDALERFPNDVAYLTRSEAERNKETTQKLLSRRLKVPFEEQWTDERVAAVCGADIVAKRAAMSNTLWRFYKGAHGDLTLGQLKKVFKIGLFQSLWEKEQDSAKKDNYWALLQKTLAEE